MTLTAAIHAFIERVAITLALVMVVVFLSATVDLLKEVEEVFKYGFIVEERGNTTVYKPNF